MNLGQMLLVVLGVVLFSTIMLGVYNSMGNQTELTAQKIYYTQAFRIADYVFQGLEVRLISESISINDIFTNYQTETVLYGNGGPRPAINVSDINYSVNVIAQYCTEDGLFSPSETNQVKLFCRVEITAGGNPPHFVGQGEDSFSKIFYNLN
jgi:hypothetical protein